MKSDSHHDDIYSILLHCGVSSPALERMEQVSCGMQELEWKLMKRAAANGPLKSASPLGGD